jgi:hypothetical protein
MGIKLNDEINLPVIGEITCVSIVGFTYVWQKKNGTLNTCTCTASTGGNISSWTASPNTAANRRMCRNAWAVSGSDPSDCPP